MKKTKKLIIPQALMMDYPQAIVSIVMLCVCVLLGLPVWWNTTKVYRATLPHTRIKELLRLKMKLGVELHFVGDEKTFGEIDGLHEYLEQFKSFEFLIQKSKYKDISDSLKNKIIEIADDDYNHVCKFLPQHDISNKLKFNIVMLGLNTEKFSYYCQSGFSYIVSSGLNGSPVNSLKSLLHEILPLDEVTADESHVTKSLQLATGYNLAFTLAIADPSDYTPSWNIKQSIKEYLEPVLEKFDFLGPFHVSSQVLYFADLGISPRKSDNDNYFFYTKSKLPLIMNPLESRLNTYTSTYAGLNFIVYVPPSKLTPMYVKSSKSSAERREAFHSPRWGGIVFHNKLTNTSESGILETTKHMKTFITQFLLLNGLNLKKTRKIFHKNSEETISESMCMRLRVLKTFENLRTSISTLSSLSNLLDNIANIVIRDDIKVLIETSVHEIDSGLLSMRNGDILSAIDSSKIAFEKSEKAFYDWSLLSLLYFPDDQKYAIYVPLFLPISLPVVISFYKSLQWLRSKE